MKQKTIIKSFFLLFALIVGSSSVWAETVTYTVASTSSVNVSGTAPTGSSATFSNTYTNNKEQMTKDNSQTLTLSKYNGYQITGLTLSMHSNKSSGAGKLRYSVDGGENWTYLVGSSDAGVSFNNSEWHGDWSQSYVDVTKSGLDIICGESAVIIKIEATEKSLYCQSYTVTYEAAKTLDHISVTTPPTKTAYKIGEPVDLTDMVVTATYTDKSTENVTSKCTFNPASGATLDSSEDQNIAISYSGKNTTQTITVAGVTSLAVKTAPTKTAYKYGETLDLTGLELTATFSDSGTKDLTEGFTASPANGSELTASGNVALTYYGQSCNQAITVGTLSSLTYNSTGEGAFANTTYTEKDKFDPTGLVVTAHYTNGIEEEIDDYTLSPDADTELKTTDKNVAVSYTWAETERTVNIPITVNAGTKYTVSFDAGNGSYTGGDITETEYQGGITLPSATISVAGWTFAGWATASTSNTTTRPTLYSSGATYYPTANGTLYAVYKLAGIDETKYKMVTTLSEATGASSMIFVDNTNSKVFKYNGEDITYATAPTETDGLITPSDDIVWALEGNNTDGYKVKTTSLETNRYAGFTTPSSAYANIYTYPSNTLTNGLWKFIQNTSGDNLFTLRSNTEKTSQVGSLRFYASSTNKWQVYYLSSSGFSGNSNVALKLYVPVQTAYNSNPSAIITPTVEFAKGGTTLYLDGTTTYTNTATSDPAKTISYTSSDEDVATVTSTGVVTAVGIGTATITASVAAELGVNKAASDTYDVVVKNTTTIAGLKTIDSTSGEAFAADLTDAVVTYVNGNYAYIQDASAAILVNKSGHGLVAGQKINGAVSGTVKTSYSIDQLTAIDLSDATVTDDGVIPAALTKTVAEVKANAAALDGQLVTINAVTIDKPSTTTTLKDGSKIEEVEATITMYSPNSAASVNDKEKGNFTGYISLYNGETPRINLYDQSQFVKTHNAPTAQVLTFDNEDIQLDEETAALTAFTGQAVNGAHTTLTWSIEDGSDEIFTSFNTTTGALVLNGSTGSAMVNVSAAAGDVVDAGVTTPYLASDPASYMITVNARHTVTFKVLGKDIEVREVESGAGVTAPEVETMGANTFLGWTNAEISDPQDDAPSTLITETEFDGLTGDVDYYAVFGKEKTAASSGSYTLNYSVDGAPSGYGKDKNITASDGSEWVVRAHDNSGYQINTSKDSGIKLPTCPDNITTIEVTGSISNYFSFGTTLKGSAVATPTNNVIDLSSESYKTGYINPASGANIITKIVVNYVIPATYDNYCTSPSDKSNIIVENEDGDYVAEEIKLTSGEELNLEHDVIADKVTNDRILTADEGAYTWYEPYAYTLPAGNTAYTFSGVNGSALQFAELGSQDLEANTPYLVLAANSVNGSINAETVVKATPANDTESGEYGNWTFVGTYKSMTAAEAATANMWALGASNKWFYYTGSDAYGVYPRRAYMINSEDKGSGEAKIFGTDFGGSEVTHIELVNAENPDENRIYSLDGKYLGKKNEINVKGVVIENGKKVIIK